MPGEFELIAALRERVARAGAPSVTPDLRLGSGDDAAVLGGEGAVAISVDALVEDVHFRRPPFRLADVGHKALATALSDLAAMGARAGEALVQLGIPDGLDDDDCLELADGLAGVAAAHGVVIAGGDVSRSGVLFCALTVVGHAASGEALVRRAGAMPGDALAVTGELGGAVAGLLLLDRPELAGGLEDQLARRLRDRQLRPQPQLAAGRALAAAGASAMIDLSDGIGADAGHVAEAGGVELRIEAARLPAQAGVDGVAGAAGVSVADLVVGGGEDYELLVALPADRVAEATEAVGATGVELSVIGDVAEGAGVSLIGPAGEALPASGFDQLRPARPGRA
jgi:thiamine-monophosphate kinase